MGLNAIGWVTAGVLIVMVAGRVAISIPSLTLKSIVKVPVWVALGVHVKMPVAPSREAPGSAGDMLKVNTSVISGS